MNQLLQPKKWTEIYHKVTRGRGLKWIVSLGVLALSGIIPLLGSQRRMLQILFLVAGVIGVFILIQWPAIGLMGILIGTYFVSYSGPGGVNVVVLGVAAVSSLWMVDMFIQKRKIYFDEPRTTRAIFGFCASAVLSFFIGQLSWHPLAPHAPIDAQVGGMAIFILSGFAFLILSNLVDDIRWLKAFTWVFVGIGVLYIAARMNPSIANVLRNYFVPGAFTGSLFFVWILLIPLSQALLNSKMHIIWRLALFVFSLGVLYVAIVQASSWKSGYIPPLVGMSVLVVLMLRRRAIWLMPILLIGGWWVAKEAFATDQYSVLTRLEALEIVFKLSTVNPILGMGFSNYYWYTPLIPINGWQVNFSSHNQYADIFAQTGVIGLVCFFWLFWEIARLGLKLIDKVPEGFAKAYVYGALGGLAGTLVAGLFADWILPFIYNIGMEGMRSSILSWFFLGGLVVIHKIVNHTKVIGKTNSPSGGKYE